MTEPATTTQPRVFTMTRDFDAPRQLVFDAWTQPAQFARWWGGAGTTVSPDTTRIDLRVGGEWSALMHVDADGAEHPFAGVYQEIVPPERLVMTLTDEQRPNPERQHILTVTFAESAGRTTMVLTQAGDFGDAPDQTLQNLARGYGAFFDQLAVVVERR
jgi:uncharacterized protein YndB with AHSA1/START domain